MSVAVNYASEFPGAVGITLSRQSQNGKDGESTSERLHTKVFRQLLMWPPHHASESIRTANGDGFVRLVRKTCPDAENNSHECQHLSHKGVICHP
eukprot:1195173-Prorocentrum_minimum.AAC.6